MSLLKVEYNNHICKTVIQRPETHNAINFAVMEALENLLTELETNNRARCFILRGSGDSFISGGDLREFHTLKTAEEAKSMAQRMNTLLARIEMLPCWTIACINGPTYGGGCEIMLAFDFCIASHQATFGFTQGKFYLPPGWGGLTRLVERVGRSTALRWLAETSIVDPQTALDHHLIDRTAPRHLLDEQTQTWAENLCRNERDFTGALKHGALGLAEARWKSIEEELQAFSTFWEDERHHQRVENFLKKIINKT